MSLSEPFTLAGVIHLLPLPGAPRGSPGLDAVFQAAMQDAEALLAGGIRLAIVENLGDAPFRAGDVDPHVPAMMAAIGAGLRARLPELRLGVNVLRNDARAALGVAAAVGAELVRVNVHVGAAWTDQGLIQGQAHETLRYRRELCAEAVRIFADVSVKHAKPAGEADIRRLAADAALRGGADALIVTGEATGAAARLEDLLAARQGAPETPLWVGSGVTPERLPALRQVAQGAIVGTFLHAEGRLDQRVDPARVAAICGA